MRMWIRLGAAALVTLTAASGVVAQEKPLPPKQREGVIPQPPPKPKPKPKPTAAIASPIPRGSAVGDLAVDPPVAPRLGGLEPERFGGAACRTSCSSNYIFCQQQDDITSCSANWARCLAACPSASSSE